MAHFAAEADGSYIQKMRKKFLVSSGQKEIDGSYLCSVPERTDSSHALKKKKKKIISSVSTLKLHHCNAS